MDGLLICTCPELHDTLNLSFVLHPWNRRPIINSPGKSSSSEVSDYEDLNFGSETCGRQRSVETKTHGLFRRYRTCFNFDGLTFSVICLKETPGTNTFHLVVVSL